MTSQVTASTVSDTSLYDVARRARRLILDAIHVAQAGHVGGPLSCVDLLIALYFDTLNVDPERPDWPDRDRFILSKGHSSIALYTVLALRGYFPVVELRTFDAIDSRLQGHPDMTRLPGLDMSTGSLGQGLSPGAGMALGAKLRGQDFKTWVILGDGESQEGQIWEAAFMAARYRLDNLIAILDFNRLQQFGWLAPEEVTGRSVPIEYPRAKWEAFGWRVLECDGHDFASIRPTYREALAGDGRPTLIIAQTIKGKGISFMENRYDWHAKPPSAEELAAAYEELGGDE